MIDRKVDILSVTMMSSGRDAEMVIPILYYCKRFLGLSTFSGTGVDARYLIDRLNPRMLLVPNSMGDNNYIKAVRYAVKRGIPVLSLMSEGDLRESNVEKAFWGLNRDKVLYEDLNLQWTETIKDLVLKHFPELKGKIGVSGGVGFDRYKIYDFMTREEFANKYKKDYKRIVCYAGWGFDQLYGDYFELEKGRYTECYGDGQIKSFREDRLHMNEILHSLIKNNPDTLFILKYHPGIRKIKEFTEFIGLEQYENVVEIKKGGSIADFINVSDFLMAYESTAALESWLLGKQTFLINPSNSDFPRSEVSQGSPIFKTYEECQKAMDSFYKTGAIKGFKEKEAIRRKIIKSRIGWDDGKNHARVGEILGTFFGKNRDRSTKDPSSLEAMKNCMVHLIFEKMRWATRPQFISKIPIRKLKVLKYCQDIFSYRDLERLRAKYHPYLDRFYKREGIRAKNG